MGTPTLKSWFKYLPSVQTHVEGPERHGLLLGFGRSSLSEHISRAAQQPRTVTSRP